MSVADELERLEAMYDEGALSEDEFDRAKRKVLDGDGSYGSHGANAEYVRRQTNLWAMLLHLSQFASCIAPPSGLIAPIVIWQIKKNELPEIDRHGRMVTNWIVSMLVYFVISAVLCLVLVGFLLLAVLAVMAVVYPIVGGIKANNGEFWRYPLTIAFLDENPEGTACDDHYYQAGGARY